MDNETNILLLNASRSYFEPTTINLMGLLVIRKDLCDLITSFVHATGSLSDPALGSGVAYGRWAALSREAAVAQAKAFIEVGGTELLSPISVKPLTEFLDLPGSEPQDLEVVTIELAPSLANGPEYALIRVGSLKMIITALGGGLLGLRQEG
jgi:hypothetical protein